MGIKEEIKNQIEEAELKLKKLRDDFDHSDANDPVTQISTMRKIQALESRIQTLKGLLK